MIKRIGFAILLPILVYFLLAPPEAFTEQDGAQAGNSGAPGNDTCATEGCHDTFELNSGTGSITVMTPAQFSPGDTVSLSVTVAQSMATRFGFQVNIRKASEPRVTGRLILGENTRFADAIGDYITHEEAVETDGSATWTFQWAAPDEEVGNIVVYAAGVAGNSSGNRFGDRVYTATATLPILVGLEDEPTPDSFELSAAYPNPFRQQVVVRYALNHPEPVRIALYDALGRIVKTIDEGYRQTGTHEIAIEGGPLPAGTYFYEIQTPSRRESRMITHIK